MSGESHRIYWQQWASKEHAAPAAATASSATSSAPRAGGGGGGGGGGTPSSALLPRSRRELITSSAAVRITPQAQAKDVTDLLRQSLQLDGDPNRESGLSESLVLVGTLFSLPPHYVVFEHERQLQKLRDSSKERQMGSVVTGEASVKIAGSYKPSAQPYLEAAGAGAAAGPPPHRHDPFHVIRTLRPHENPLTVRDRMVERLRQLQQLAPSSRTIISPKLQFFYVHPTSHIHACIELDGYATSMEDEEEDGSYYEDDVDPEEELHCSFQEEADWCDGVEADVEAEMCRRFPWLSPSPSSEAATSSGPPQLADPDRRRRDGRFRQYLGQATARTASCLTGFLLKQSRDPHVWRRVHCALTDDRLWFASRVYHRRGSAQGGRNGEKEMEEGRARHGSIRLTRALLIPADPPGGAATPTFPNRVLRATPWAFELVSGRGTSHVFRASAQGPYARWIRALHARISQSGENSLVDHAELLLADEGLARTQRVTACAVLPLWEALRARFDSGAEPWDPRRRRSGGAPLHDFGFPVGAVLRWGLRVAEFKETCRDLHARLPPKRPVVATSPSSSSSSQPPGEGGGATSEGADADSWDREPLEPFLWHMIQGAWDEAAGLLSRAEQLGRDILQLQQQQQHQQQTNSEPHRSSLLLSSVETHCRHVEYLITGRFRSLGNHGSHHPGADDPPLLPPRSHLLHRDPPPLDLFDPLLRDLQAHAAAASAFAVGSLPDGDAAFPRNRE